MRMRIVLGVCGAWLAAGMLGGGTLQAQERFSREEREDDARDRARALARPLSVTPEERAQGLEQLMATATERFHAGRWDEAKAALDKIFAENPTAEEAVALRAMFGERILMEMALAVQDGRNLGEGPSMLLARANDREREELAGTPERVAAVVDEALRPRERDQFGKVLDRGPMYRLTLLGPYAAPRLIFQMRASPDEAIRVNALLLLANLGPQMVMPVTVALDGLLDREAWDADEADAASNLAEVLGRVLPRDPRALPSLERFAADERRPQVARDAARRAADAILAGLPEVRADASVGLADRYYAAAERLHLDNAEVRRELDQLRQLYFAWDDKAHGDAGGLVYNVVPAFLLNDLYAQALAAIGMRLPAGDENGADDNAARFQALMARIWIDQADTLDQFANVIGRQTVWHHDDEAQDAEVRAWQRHFEAVRRKTLAVGVPVLAQALDESLRTYRHEVSVGLIRALTRTAAKTDGVTWALRAALQSDEPRVRQYAAASLACMGVNAATGETSDIVPNLVDGAVTKNPRVVLVISNNDRVRADVARRLESHGVVALTAPSGREGTYLAWQFPLKDAILIDGKLREYETLRPRLEALSLAVGGELPVVIVSNAARADDVADQFKGEHALWRLLPTQRGVTLDDVELYDKLVRLNRSLDAGQRGVVVLAVDDDPAADGGAERAGKTREMVANYLRLEAERRASARTRGELVEWLAEDRLRNQNVELRALYANVFVDDDLTGMNAERTIQELRGHYITRGTPVAFLAAPVDRRDVEARFAEHLKNPADARMLDLNADGAALLAAVEDMAAVNPLAKLDRQHRFFEETALFCAQMLGQYDTRDGAERLAAEQAARLREALLDPARTNAVRQSIAWGLGNWAEASASAALAKVYDDKKNDYGLRHAALFALGETDREGRYQAMKIKALRQDPAPQLRDTAAVALAKQTTTPAARMDFLLDPEQWEGEPMNLIAARPTAVADGAAAAPAAAGDEELEDIEDNAAPAAAADDEEDDWN